MTASPFDLTLAQESCQRPGPERTTELVRPCPPVPRPSMAPGAGFSLVLPDRPRPRPAPGRIGGQTAAEPAMRASRGSIAIPAARQTRGRGPLPRRAGLPGSRRPTPCARPDGRPRRVSAPRVGAGRDGDRSGGRLAGAVRICRRVAVLGRPLRPAQVARLDERRPPTPVLPASLHQDLLGLADEP